MKVRLVELSKKQKEGLRAGRARIPTLPSVSKASDRFLWDLLIVVLLGIVITCALVGMK